MKLSDRIASARSRHKAEYPDGNWRSVNDEFSALFEESYPILRSAGHDPWRVGNEGREMILRRIGH